MTRRKQNKGLVLAVHPTARGFGWVLFEAPLSPVDWGMVFATPGRNERLLNRFERLLQRYEPSVLVLEAFESGVACRADRIQRLCRSLIHLAACRGMDTPVYSKAVVRTCFASVGAVTRYEIAEVIRQQIDAFKHKPLRKRRTWDNLDSRQSLFDAAALAMTYFGLLSDTQP